MENFMKKTKTVEVCTYAVDSSPKVQEWVTCYTCFKSEHEGVCKVCMVKCHSGHELSAIKKCNFFCDCECSKSKDMDEDMDEDMIQPLEIETGKYTPVDTPRLSLIILSPKSFKESTDVVALKLMKNVKRGSVFSPMLSVLTSLIQLGAQGNTRAELTNLMGREVNTQELLDVFKRCQTDQVKSANNIIVNNSCGLKKEYVDFAKELAQIRKEDFTNPSAVVKIINDMVNEQTKGKISNIINPGDLVGEIVMVMLSTIFLSAKWENPFEVHESFKGKFNGTTPVVMMQQTESHGYYEDSFAQVAQLMYEGNKLCMKIILPKEGVDLSKPVPNYLNSGLFPKRSLKLTLPKFSQSTEIDLVESFKQLGVIDLFDRKKADLSGMTNSSFVSVMRHKATITVTEKGTEAAAATMAVFAKECCYHVQQKPTEFNANRTFMYAIQDVETGMTYFVGEFNGVSS